MVISKGTLASIWWELTEMADNDSQVSSRSRFFTSQGTVMFVDPISGELRHGPPEGCPSNVVLVRDGERAKLTFVNAGCQEDIVCWSEYSAAVGSEKAQKHRSQITGTVFTYIPTANEEFGLAERGKILCAERDGRITLSRPFCLAWDAFRISNVRNLQGTICSNDISGKRIHFFVVNKNDAIQRHHYRGCFYEIEEMGIISEFFQPGGVFLDIGTNIGNHSIFVCKYLNPAQIIAIEPNPEATAILEINVALNGLNSLIDLSHLGIGLSDSSKKAIPVVPSLNLGGTTMQVDEKNGTIPLIRGDDILLGHRIDFIKLDVEGMEMDVLAGLAGTISKERPLIFIEIDNTHVEAFQSWIKANDYVIVRKYRRHAVNENYMVMPKEKIRANSS